jgi:hypothetical protein
VELDPLTEADRPLVALIGPNLLSEAIELRPVSLIEGGKPFERRHQASLIGLQNDVLAVDDVLRRSTRHSESKCPAALYLWSGRRNASCDESISARE